MIPRFFRNWLSRPSLRDEYAAILDANLAQRKALRQRRSEAASKGWDTRRGRV